MLRAENIIFCDNKCPSCHTVVIMVISCRAPDTPKPEINRTCLNCRVLLGYQNIVAFAVRTPQLFYRRSPQKYKSLLTFVFKHSFSTKFFF